MRVRVKQRKLKFKMMSCGCCESVYFKDRCFDKQTLKEALEDIHENQIEEDWL